MPKSRMYGNLLSAIGNTPLVQVNMDADGRIFAKLEYLNPGGSIKDRSALHMIEDAERRGIIRPGGTLIEASSGNQGIAAAMIGAIKGYKVIVTVSEKNSREKVDTIKAYGAEVIVCPVTKFLDDPENYHNKAQEIQRKTPNSFLLNQFYNPANAAAHYHSLGPEIWDQTEGRVTHFVAATGTCGTVSGAGKFLKEQNPEVKVIGIDSANSYRSTNGNPKPYELEGVGVDFDSPLLKEAAIDQFVTVTDSEALGMLRQLASAYGFLVGMSSGAVAAGVQKMADVFQEKDLVVMIFGDSGRAYLSKSPY